MQRVKGLGQGRRIKAQELFVCKPLNIGYGFKQKMGRAWFADGHCCDMNGCLEFFMTMDENVAAVFTFSGTVPDTAYVKKKDGRWVAWAHGSWMWNEQHDCPQVGEELISIE